MQNSCWKACSKTKHQKNHIVCIVPKELCNILTRMLKTRLFSEKTAFANWIMHSGICRSVLPSSFIAILSKSTNVSCSEWHFLSNGMVLTTQRMHLKILISKHWWCSACASWFTKDQEGCKLYWASGNKVLDTFSTIQYTVGAGC